MGYDLSTYLTAITRPTLLMANDDQDPPPQNRDLGPPYRVPGRGSSHVLLAGLLLAGNVCIVSFLPYLV